ncbi:MAG: extracellular solute-binding protein [Rhodobacter sp.]|nr:extracellular solute-binding protein [Rhodobacter sp.]
MTDRQPKALALARTAPSRQLFKMMMVVPFSILALALMAVMARAEVIRSHGISTFGELTLPADFPYLPYVNPDAPKGGEISISWSSGNFDSMHPYTRKGRSAVMASVFFESMLESPAHVVGESYCLLCEYMEYPESKEWVIFKIRDEARFSDGTPLTAQDALFSFEILRDEGLPSFRASIIKTIAGAEVLDDKRIKFTFNEDAPLRGRIDSAGGLPVFSEASHIAAGIPFEDNRLEPLVGSGPYTLGEIDVGNRVVYTRNPDYWGENLPLTRGRNNFDAIRIEYYGDGIAAFEGFKAGNYTFRQENSSKVWANDYDFPGLSAGYVIKKELPDDTITSGQSFIINLRREKFQDVRVREALTLMFNFEWTNKTLFFGQYSQGPSFWQNTDLQATGMPTPGELAILEPLRDKLRPEVFEQEAYSLTPSSPDDARDRRKARKALRLLQDVGYEAGDDGMLRKDGKTLVVEFLNSSPLFDRIINPYVANLRSIGVDASLNRVDNAQETQRERDYDFDIITGHIAMGYEPGSGLRQYFGSESKNASVFNLSGVGNETFDVLIDAVVNAETKDDMITAAKALDRVLRWERIRIPQWYNANHWVAYFDMYEHPDPLPRYSLGFLDFWWWNAEKAAALKAAGAL